MLVDFCSYLSASLYVVIPGQHNKNAATGTRSIYSFIYCCQKSVGCLSEGEKTQGSLRPAEAKAGGEAGTLGWKWRFQGVTERPAVWKSTNARVLSDHGRKTQERDWTLGNAPKGKRKKRTHRNVDAPTGPGEQTHTDSSWRGAGFGWRWGRPGVYVGAGFSQRVTCLFPALSCRELEIGHMGIPTPPKSADSINQGLPPPPPPAHGCKYYWHVTGGNRVP